MKIRLLIILAAVVFTAGLAYAGEYHTDATLNCSDCHTSHYSENGGIPSGAGSAGPYSKLLKDNVNELCLTCHDGGSGAQGTAPDVFGTAVYESGSVKRAAGFFQSTLGSLAHNGHSLGVASDAGTQAPGGSGSWTVPAGGLTCTTCHDPHGNGNYRNLRTSVGNSSGLSVTYSVGMTNDTTKDVFQRFVSSTSAKYSVWGGGSSTSGVSYNRPVSSSSAYANWCKGCHTNIHGTVGDTGPGGAGGADGGDISTPWFKHPTADVTIGANSNKHSDYSHWSAITGSRLPVMSTSGSVPNQDNAPSCMSCHKAHGSSHKYGLIYENEATSDLEDGTRLIQTCQQCHNK